MPYDTNTHVTMTISRVNHYRLAQLGHFGQSFDDILTFILTNPQVIKILSLSSSSNDTKKERERKREKKEVSLRTTQQEELETIERIQQQ